MKYLTLIPAVVLTLLLSSPTVAIGRVEAEVSAGYDNCDGPDSINNGVRTVSHGGRFQIYVCRKAGEGITAFVYDAKRNLRIPMFTGAPVAAPWVISDNGKYVAIRSSGALE